MARLAALRRPPHGLKIRPVAALQDWLQAAGITEAAEAAHD
jgi:hypothetical protein